MIDPKGKAKAPSTPTPSERSPLLASHPDAPSTHLIPFVPPPSPPRTPDRTLRSRILFVFLLSLSLAIGALIILILTAYSYVVRLYRSSPDHLLHRGLLVIRGPDHLELLNTTTPDNGIWLSFHARIGLDLNLTVGSTPLLAALARRGISALGHITLRLGLVTVSSGHNFSLLATVFAPQLLELPLNADPDRRAHDDLSWLTPVSIPVLVRPTQDPSILEQFTRDSWHAGVIDLDLVLDRILVRGGKTHDTSWRRRLELERTTIQSDVRIEIPPLNGLPGPGPDTPLPSLTDLVKFQSIQLLSTSNHISLHANATLLNPIPHTLTLAIPPLPFIISLPSPNTSSLPLATVHTTPFTLTHPTIPLFISGHLLPLSTHPFGTTLFSTFLSTYLDGRPNPITLTTPLLPALAFPALFPGPQPKPHILRAVTIRDMHLKPAPSDSPFVASGVVHVRVVLPRGMQLDLNVTRVWPDVYVLDGEPPPEDEMGLRTTTIELPERAFGHIDVDEWLDSVTVPDDDDDDDEDEEEGDRGSAYIVSAAFSNVPLRLLPGREKKFRAFVSKVIFGSGGAVAGLLGTVDAQADVHGLGGEEIELDRLPFRGSVRVSKETIGLLNLRDWLRHHFGY